LDFLTSLNLVDVGIVLLILWGVVAGYRRGLIHGLINLIAFIAAIVCGMVYNEQIAAMLEQQFGVQTFFREKIAAGISGFLSASLPGAVEGVLPGADFLSQLQRLPLPAATLQYLEGQLTNLPGNVIGSVGDSLADLYATPLANLILSALIFCVNLAVFSLAAAVIYWLLKDILRIAKSPLDSIAGLVFGLIKSALLVSVILALLSPLQAWMPESSLATMLQSSMLANPFLTIFYLIVGQSLDLWQRWLPQ